jgi:hypothetical protein
MAKIESPAPRDQAQEGRDTLQAQIDLAPQQFGAEAEYQPKYAQLSRDILGQSLFGTGGTDQGILSLIEQAQPSFNRISATANRAQRESDIGDVEALGTRATEAWKQANPDQAQLMDMLNQQAQSELGSGAALDPALARQMSQSVRAGQAARGMGTGAADADVEGLVAGQGAEALRRARQGFAMDVVRANQATATDPFQAILGRPAQSWGAAQNALQQAGGASKLAGGASFDPWSAYASDLYNTNFNAEAAANIASGNAKTALAAAGIGAAGSAAGAM